MKVRNHNNLQKEAGKLGKKGERARAWLWRMAYITLISLCILSVLALVSIVSAAPAAYDWEIRTEDNGDLYSLLDNHIYKIYWYFDDGTGEIVILSGNSGTWNNTENKTVTKVELSDDGGSVYYIRTLAPQDENSLTFYLPQEQVYRDNIKIYTFELEDWTDLYVPPDGWMKVQKLVGDDLVVVNSDYWNANRKYSAHLVQGHSYRLVLKSDGQEHVEDFTAGYDYSPTLVIRPTEPENVTYLRNNWTWAAWRDNTLVKISYDDGWENTENATVRIYLWGEDDNLYGYFTEADSFDIQWDSGDNENTYIVELVAIHGIFGTVSENKVVGGWVEAQGVEVPDDVDDIVGAPEGVSVASLVSLFALLVVALTFGSLFPSQAMFGISLCLLILRLFGFISFTGDFLLIGFLITISVLFHLGRTKGG